MKNKLQAFIMGIALTSSVATVWAANVKDINYSSKANALLGGGQYYIYNVRCSDGRKAVISGWDGKKTWCLDKSKKQCSNDQLKTAKEACQ